MSSTDKERYNADIRATNILLQGLPKDIYSLINHYTDAKDIWDNVKMLLEGSELTKEDRESQLYDDFKHFRQHKGETIHDYYNGVVFNSSEINRGLRDSNYDQITSSNPRNQATVQDGKVLVQNVQGRQNRGQGNNTRVQVQLVMGELRTESGILIQENRVALDEEQLLFFAGGQDNAVDEDVDEQHVQDLALNEDNVFQADDCDAFDSDVDEAPTAQTMFIANLSSADLVYDEADVQPNYVVDSHVDYTSDSNMIPYDQYVKDNAVPVVQSNVSSIPNDAYMMIYVNS
ncbi:hypothetical protein Tco_0684312 [Tanacetum coccineum]